MRLPRIWALAALLALAGCGGGLWFSYGFDSSGDRHPQVSLAVNPQAARSGETVHLVAAASDDLGVDRVSFYRIEATGGDTLLGADDIAPYEIDVVITGAGDVQFFARAFDDLGQSGDSATVSVAVVP